MKNYDLTSLNCALKLHKLKSFTAVAKEMGLSKVSISKRINSLEVELGYSLFERSTRSVKSTQKCKKIIPKIQEIINKLDLLSEDFDTETSSGLIKITLNSTLAHSFIEELLYRYQKKNPKLQIEVIVSDDIIDFNEDNVDIALRVNPNKKSFLIGKKVNQFKLCFVASKKVIKKYNIKNTTDLISLEEVPFLATNHHMSLLLRTNKKLGLHLQKNQFFKTNDSLLINKKIIQGEGYGLRANWDLHFHKKKNKYDAIFPNALLNEYGDVWLLSHPEKLKINRVRALYNFLEKELPVLF